ncbi:hypothetical protein FCV25MIE_07564 [Fagus crenata]
MIMDFLRTVVGLVTFHPILFGHAVEGISLSKEQDAEFERELMTINKPAVKTIKTKHGHIYDCVNIHEQPALDNPLLKNHKVQMTPSSALLKNLRSSSSNKSSSIANPAKIGLEIKCPKGTVVIQRTTKEDLIRAKYHFRRHLLDDADPGSGYSTSSYGYDFAGIYLKPDANKKYYGVGATIAIYKPVTISGQISAALIRLESGGPGYGGFVETGWMVNPDLYNDDRARLFTKWSQVNNGRVSGCYNTDCPGFVVQSSSIPLNAYFANFTTVRGVLPRKQYEYRFSIKQDSSTGNIWAFINNGNVALGYWPKELFTNLGNGADTVYWGGMVYSNLPKSPPMGSGGRFKDGNYDRTCYMKQMSVRTVPGAPFVTADDALVLYKDSRCYGAADYGNVEGWGYRFLFGGKGGNYEIRGCKDLA